MTIASWVDKAAVPPTRKDVSKTDPMPVQIIGPGGGGGGATAGDGASDTGTPTTVAGSASAVTILAANTARYGATIVNDSSAILYLILSNTTPTSSVYTVKMLPDAYYEVPFGYIGIIKGIWASATGNARVTELT